MSNIHKLVVSVRTVCPVLVALVWSRSWNVMDILVVRLNAGLVSYRARNLL